MSDVPRRPADRRGGPRGRWLLVAVLPAPAVVLPLWVPLYDREGSAWRPSSSRTRTSAPDPSDEG